MLLACALERGACPHIVTDVVVANDKVDSSAARWRERSKGGGDESRSLTRLYRSKSAWRVHFILITFSLLNCRIRALLPSVSKSTSGLRVPAQSSRRVHIHAPLASLPSQLWQKVLSTRIDGSAGPPAPTSVHDGMRIDRQGGEVTLHPQPGHNQPVREVRLLAPVGSIAEPVDSRVTRIPNPDVALPAHSARSLHAACHGAAGQRSVRDCAPLVFPRALRCSWVRPGG